MNRFYVFIISVLLVSVAQAGKPVGPAGCGLGNVIFGKDSQILAATTNGSSYSQTFGITSGTSNCEQSSGMAKLESYIEANPEALANDMARGEGETLVGLTEVLQCSNPTTAKTVLKSNFKQIYQNGTNDTAHITNGVREVLKEHGSQDHGCRG